MELNRHKPGAPVGGTAELPSPESRATPQSGRNLARPYEKNLAVFQSDHDQSRANLVLRCYWNFSM